ncbi:hypothetical protein HOK51_06520 [Candidatus Woesearchaeota archaeon]|jgi:hypothetical protein|nr:hypothetical protein [Candidatus Woesearchaeota archaeon]MBT6519478.1 hypothetical protein [Candidatus Woesearchaeota archaeon]MBT7368226.1 hypothetical protein [Candidatus Woesearchaeota archaeon]
MKNKESKSVAHSKKKTKSVDELHEEIAKKATKDLEDNGFDSCDNFSDSDPSNKGSDRKLVILLGILVLIFAAFFLGRFVLNDKQIIKSPDQLHSENIAGDLDSEEGYVYNGYSFVNFGGVWYTQAQLENAIYDLAFNNDPESIKHIPVEGILNEDYFAEKKLWITFDSNATASLKYIAVANGGFSTSLAKAFGYWLESGCTSHEDPGCRNKEITTCDDLNKSVVYFKEGEPTKIIYDSNCIIIQGVGEDIVKAKDRLLMRWYKIMP